MSGAVIDSGLSPWRALSGNLRRNRRNMLFAFFGTTVLCGGIAAVMPPKYRSTAELMVRLGPEYLINADPATTSVFMERREIVASEVAMLSAPELGVRVINEVGLARIYPGIAEDVDASDPGSAQAALEKALLRFERHLSVLPVKDSTLLSANFTSDNPEVAAEVLSRLIQGYLIMRKKHFAYTNADSMQPELASTRSALEEAATRLEAFRHEAGITDFDAQMTHLIDEKAGLLNERNKTASDIAALGASVAVLSASLDSIGKWVPLKTETVPSDAAQAVRAAAAELKLKRSQILLQFKNGVPQIDDIDRQIGMALSLQRAYDRDASSHATLGRPGAYDSVQAMLSEKQSSLAANQERLRTLDAELSDVESTILRLDSNRSALSQLVREQKVAEDSFFQGAKRLSEERAHDQLVDVARPNVEIVQEPRVPFKETPLRIIIAAMGIVMGAIFAALLAYVDDLGRARRAL